ncbi:tyrosine-type recombinase/integrase [Gimesia maris]|uniref:tyrosine-type recombinase/integrase n=1 Tax=Gimesia maris TaxID=122 RepID=UPI0032EFD8D4
MPNKKIRKPAYQLHKASGQARVRINGNDHYLGPYGSQESRDEYDKLISVWLSRQDVSNVKLTIADLSLLFIGFADGYYRKADGVPTSEAANIRKALKYLVRLFRNLSVREFSPLKLQAVRDEMIAHGLVRTSINRNIGRIKRMFRWGVENELVNPLVFQAVQSVAGLRAGRSGARESDPVKPVPSHRVEAVKPFVSRQVWGMVELQLTTGMRPGEVIQIRGSDLNMDGEVWEYRPRRHKGEHVGKERVIYIGPRGKKVVREFLKTDLEAYLFSPSDAKLEYYASLERKTPMTPSAQKRRRKRKPKKQPGNCYTVCSYGQAIRKACEKAFDMPVELRKVSHNLPDDQRCKIKEQASSWRKEWCWHPHQLRHNAGTELRREFGIEAARLILGHSSAAITEIYAEIDRDQAKLIAGKVG